MEQREKEEVLIDIKNDDHDPNKGKKSLNNLVSRILSFNGSSDDGTETTSLLGENEREGGKGSKAVKPPRPPKGPALDAAGMRLLKEISRIAIKKRRRKERVRAFRRMKESSSPPFSSSSSLWTSVATFSALFVAAFFFLMLILQGSNLTIAVAPPRPAPETRGLSPLQFYEKVISDDGTALSYLQGSARPNGMRMRMEWK